MEKELIELQHADGSTNLLSFFRTQKEAAPVFLCLPAMGVRASFYKTLARRMADQGIHAFTLDWRGQGLSSIRASRAKDFGYKQLLEDIDDAVRRIRELFPAQRIYLIGHSLGGQLGSLFTSQLKELVGGLVLVASCTIYHKAWKGHGAWKIMLGECHYTPSCCFCRKRHQRP